MEFAGGVEDDLAPGQLPHLVAGGHPQGAPIHIKQFPEVMGLPGKGVASGVLKIVHRVDLLHADGALGQQGKISHGKNSLSTLRVFFL